MCDVNPDKLDAEQNMIPKERTTMLSKTCMKCKKEKAVVVIRIHDPMCRNCFLTYVTHKFRSTLGKSKLVQANDKVLTVVTGDHGSTALLHLVRDALSLGAHKRLRFNPAVLFVDESVTLSTDTTGAHLAQDYSHVEEIAQTFGYPFFNIPIYEGFAKTDASGACNGDVNGIAGDEKKFRQCFESISSLTAKQDFLCSTRCWLIAEVARREGYKKVMLGETSTSLCMKLISNISLGRGNTVALDLGVADTRHTGVTIIRPMREISSKEVAMFNRLSDIEVHLPRNLWTAKKSGASLQHKTEEFISGLVSDFPHTVNTVFRTGDKVCSSRTNTPAHERSTCPMCRTPITHTNRTLNTPNGDGKVVNGDGDEGGGCCGSGGGECGSSKCSQISSEDVRGRLCYACNLTFLDMGYNVDVLPSHVVQEVSVEANRDRMKDSIKEFLLE